jgi:hypothetical protein
MYPPSEGVQLTRAPGRGARGVSFVDHSPKGCPMADYVECPRIVYTDLDTSLCKAIPHSLDCSL